MGCREGLEAAAPSTVKESPLRPCSGWRREKCWADGWPARVPYTAGEKKLCLLTCGSPAASGQAAKGERRTRPPTASPSENEGELDLHTKPRRVVVTDLSEESAFGAARNAFAVWPRPVTVKRLSSFRPGGQERPGLAEAAGLLGPLHVNPLAWLLAGRRPAAGSPNRSRGKARGLGSAARGLPPGGRLLPRHRGGGSWKIPCSPRHELIESSRLGFGWAELVHYSANSLPEQPRLWDGCVH